MKKTILLVEDDVALVDVYKIAIRDLKNIDLEVASLGKKAMERIFFFKQKTAYEITV